MAVDDDVGARDVASFPPEPRSVAKARAVVREALQAWPEWIVDEAILLASELATNAVTHAGTVFELKVTVAERVVRVDVTDWGGGSPAILDPIPDVGGHGLRMVDQIAARWGTRKEDDQTVVWFEVER